MNYYYLAASLPMLTLEGEPGISSEQFAVLCEEHFTRNDLLAFRQLVEGRTHDSRHPFVLKWHERETRLRNAVTRNRAQRTDRDPADYLVPEHGFDTLTEKAVSDAFARPSPLDRELHLDRFRWALAEETAGYNSFSSSALLAYAIKLKIAARWAQMSPEKGEEEVKKVISDQLSVKEEKALILNHG